MAWVLGCGAILLVVIPLFSLVEFRKAGRVVDQALLAQGVVPVDSVAGSEVPDSLAWAPLRESLATRLRAIHGWRWRHRQPWLLLTGDDDVIEHLLPGLAETGWLITPDAVLLWSKGGEG
ncbi:hypothetical protein, partial [Cupriavidus basilensis]|uniref:hypothetical protein n=1 Tax=Cupriavidus basilensis TaxID=68895 RepID=UPI0018CEC6FD